MTDEQRSLLTLHLTPGVGGGITRTLLSHFGSAREILATSPAILKKVDGIGRTLSTAIHSRKHLREVDNCIRKCTDLGIEIIDFKSDLYPKRMKHAVDAPLLLFFWGNAELNRQKVISIVGTRKATDYGVDFVKKLINDLKEHNPLIVSGLAYGIDIAAHKASLENDLETIAVLASGVNSIYPYEHINTANKIKHQGGLLSEYPPGELADPKKFPARNRIIASLCDAVIVVEAAERGGALITALQANDYNREVFALPGDVGRAYSAGTNNLLKRHQARIITEAADIEYALGWDQKSREDKTSVLPDLPEEESLVYSKIKELGEPHIDQLCWVTGISISKIASILLNLEFGGYIRSLPGKKFKLSNLRIHV